MNYVISTALIIIGTGILIFIILHTGPSLKKNNVNKSLTTGQNNQEGQVARRNKPTKSPSPIISQSDQLDGYGVPIEYMITNADDIHLEINDELDLYTSAIMDGFQPKKNYKCNSLQSALSINEEQYFSVTPIDVANYMRDNVSRMQKALMNTKMPLVSYHMSKESYRAHVSRKPSSVYSMNYTQDDKGYKSPVTIIGWKVVGREFPEHTFFDSEPQVVWILKEKAVDGTNILYLRGDNLNKIETDVYTTQVKIN